MTSAPAYRTHSIDWTGHNLADVQRFVGKRYDYDRIGIPTEAHAFTVQADGTGRLWLEDEKTWVDVPVGHRIFRDLLERRWSMSPQALAATRDPIASAIVDVVVKPAETVQQTNRRVFGVLQKMRRRYGR